MAAYIEDKGDYSAVNNCQCYDACEDTAYESQVFEGIWPAGTFFYGGFCPRANKLNPVDCSEFYRQEELKKQRLFSVFFQRKRHESRGELRSARLRAEAGGTDYQRKYMLISMGKSERSTLD